MTYLSQHTVTIMTIKSPVKLFALGLGTIFGLTQIGLIGMIARQIAEESRFPTLPVGPYTSYRIASNADCSYDMAYRANDPLVMSNVKDIEKRGGFLGSKKENIKTTLNDLISKDKKIISIFPGSRKSETNVLLPILLDFITSSLARILSVIIILSIGEFSILSIAGSDSTP